MEEVSWCDGQQGTSAAYLGQLRLGVDCNLTKVAVIAGAGAHRPVGSRHGSSSWFRHRLLRTVLSELGGAGVGLLKIHTEPETVNMLH